MKRLFVLLFFLLALPAHAHQASTSYLQLRSDDSELSGRWESRCAISTPRSVSMPMATAR